MTDRIRALRLSAQQQLTAANASDAFLADEMGDSFLGQSARIRIAARQIVLAALGGPDRR